MITRDPIKELLDILNRTGYVRNIEIFSGEFHEDSRNDKNPFISYEIDILDNRSNIKMCRLEREIRQGAYDNLYPSCAISTKIDYLPPNKEKHTIEVEIKKSTSKNERYKIAARMAIRLKKIIEEDHFKR
jgi:hypothetical protein